MAKPGIDKRDLQIIWKCVCCSSIPHWCTSMILDSIEVLNLPSFHYSAPSPDYSCASNFTHLLNCVAKRWFRSNESDFVEMKQTKKGKVQTTKNAAGAKHAHFIWGVLSASLNSRNAVLYPHAVLENHSSAWWDGFFLFLQVNVGVSAILVWLYIPKRIAAQGFRCQTGFHPAQLPIPISPVPSPEADWTAGLWGALWHMTEDDSALSSLRQSNHSRNYLARFGSGFYLSEVPFFCK